MAIMEKLYGKRKEIFHLEEELHLSKISYLQAILMAISWQLIIKTVKFYGMYFWVVSIILSIQLLAQLLQKTKLLYQPQVELFL